MERDNVDLPSETTADVGSDAALSPGSPPADRLPDFLLAAAVDDAVIGDVLADLPEAQPERSLRSATDFSSLYVRHRSGLAAHARRYLRDARDVDEVVQETFLRLFLAISEIETELQAIAFARRTLTNLCIDRYRADRRRPTLITLDANPFFDVNAAAEEPDPVLQAEDAAVVRDALARLSPLHRAALVKREIEEKGLPQIAAELGVAEESVKHLLFRARRALRRLLIGTSVEPGIDLSGVEGAPRRPSPLVRGATVFVFFLVGALVVATGIRPLLSGGGHARVANDAVAPSGLGASGPDAPAPKGIRPASAPRHRRGAHPDAGSSGAVSAGSSGSAPTLTLGQPPSPTTHHPKRNSPVRDFGPRGHFKLNGPLKVTGTPRVVQGGAVADGTGTSLVASSFTATTDHGRFDLNQSVSRSASDGTSVVVTPSFVDDGTVEQPDITGSAAAVGTGADGAVTVDVSVETRPNPSASFALTSLTAHLVLSPDLTEVRSETVTLVAGAADQGPPTVANGPAGGQPPSSTPTPPSGKTPTPAPTSGSTPTPPPSAAPPTAAPSAPSGSPTGAAATDTAAADPATAVRE